MAAEGCWPAQLFMTAWTGQRLHEFQFEIDRFIVEHLSANPLLGHIYHEACGIRRHVFQKRYNIYFTLRDETVFVLFILDGRVDIKQPAWRD